MVRANNNEPSYGGDYQDMQKLKRIADAHNITILLVHHLRKQGDRDPVNRLSGTTGISGAVDAVFVLDRKERAQNAALLVCTGRDVEYRELGLTFRSYRSNGQRLVEVRYTEPVTQVPQVTQKTAP